MNWRLTVLEYSTGCVYSYSSFDETMDTEDYLVELGFDLSDCHYMVHREPIKIY